MSEPFIGEIKMVGFNFAPRGWASCNGQLLPISQNTALFSLIGTTYGGDGRTTFALPDLRGRAPIHQGGGTGLSNRAIGQKGGAERVALSALEMPAHSHGATSTLQASNDAVNSPTPTNHLLGNTGFSSIYRTDLSKMVDMSSASIKTEVQSTGAGQSHENMMPFLVIQFCIALLGIFPSRS